MKHLKKLFIVSFMMISLITFSSCSFITDFLNSIQAEGEKAQEETPKEDNKKEEDPTKVDETTPTTSNSTSESGSTDDASSNTTIATNDVEPVIIDELDYGYKDLESFGLKYEDYQKFYKDVKRSLEKFYINYSNLTPTSVTINGETGNYHFIDEVSYLDYNISDSEALVVVKEVLLDYPEYYFVANEALTSNATSNGVYTKKAVKLVCDADFINGELRQQYNQKIETFTNTISTMIENKELELGKELTNKEKVRLIHDYIINNASYAYKEDGKTPDDKSISHNMLGIIENGKGVCESYTELFTYLLKKNNIPTITVSGKGYTGTSSSGENHAWNYVYLDGYWYGFDVTWDDTANTNDYYGKSGLKFINIRVENGNKYIRDSSRGAHEARESAKADRLNYLYQLPALSGSDLEE